MVAAPFLALYSSMMSSLLAFEVVQYEPIFIIHIIIIILEGLDLNFSKKNGINDS